MIPAEETHRIRNAGDVRGRILEIAYGYTTEDDTQRLEDAYGRPLGARLVSCTRRHPCRRRPLYSLAEVAVSTCMVHRTGRDRCLFFDGGDAGSRPIRA